MEEKLKPFTAKVEQATEVLREPFAHFSGSSISLSGVLLSIFIFIAALRIAKYLGAALNRALRMRDVDSGVRDSLEKFARYTVIVIGIMFAMDNLGISLKSLTAIGAILMVGIGFGLQNITQNFISGLMLLIERPIKVGDIVIVGNNDGDRTEGRVIDIRVRSTVIQTRDNVTIIVPNSRFVSEEVTNESYGGQKIRHHIKVGIAYGTDVQLVMETMVEAAKQHESVLKEPEPVVLLKNFGQSAMEFDLRFWSEDIWRIEPITSDIRVVIERLFRERKIEIAFQQMDLNLKGDGMARLQRSDSPRTTP